MVKEFTSTTLVPPRFQASPFAQIGSLPRLLSKQRAPRHRETREEKGRAAGPLKRRPDAGGCTKGMRIGIVYDSPRLGITMKRILVLLIVAACAQASDLQRRLDAVAASHQGKIAFYAKNLKSGETVAIRADEPVQTASVIKLPIMLEAMYQVKAGKLKLDERQPLTKENQVEGSGVLTFMQPGLEPTLQDAITLMIILSDNAATNMVIDRVGIPAVNARIAAMGLKNTYLYKKIFKPPVGPQPPDQKKFGLGKTTAREMAEVMEAIERCDLKDDQLCKKMIDILRNQQDREMIPRYIEVSDTSVEASSIVNKTGAEDDVRNDVALVYSRTGPIIISAFTWDNKDQRWTCDNQAQELIARMAREIVGAWTGVKPGVGAK